MLYVGVRIAKLLQQVEDLFEINYIFKYEIRAVFAYWFYFYSSGGTDRKVKLWETVGNGTEMRAILTGCNGGIFSIDFDSTGSMLVCTSSDFACRVWTVDDHRLRVNMSNKTALLYRIYNATAAILLLYSMLQFPRPESYK